MPMHSRTGFSTDLPGATLYDYGLPNPFSYSFLEDDFHTFTAAQWTVTETQAGATQAMLADEDGGAIALVNSAADNDLNSIQRVASGVSVESFRWAAANDMFFTTRLKVDQATLSDVVAGLLITDTSPLDTTDGIFFYKAEGATSIQFRVEKDNTASTLTVGNMADNTWVQLGFFYNSQDGLFHVFLNDAEVGTVAATNAPDDESLTPTFAVQNGSAAARTLTVDYFLVAKKRQANWS